MKRVEIKLRDVRVTAIEIEPVNWWAKLLSSLAHWHYKLEFTTLKEGGIYETLHENINGNCKGYRRKQ